MNEIEEREALQKLSSGVDGLDELLRGGLPENEDGIGPLQSTQSFPVLKAGWVLLQGEVVKSVWKRRWLELSADALRYYKKEGGKDYNISPDVVVLMQDILNVQRETQHGVRLVLVSADAAMRRQKRTSRSWIEATMK